MQVENIKTGSIFRITANNKDFGGAFGSRKDENLLTIAWNIGPDQNINIDGTNHEFKKNSITTLTANQNFELGQPESVIAWQFNRAFYCIIDHDAEVSCSGLIFYGSAEQLIICVDEEQSAKIHLLFQIFVDEFAEKDNLQEDMLRMLLKRLIIKITRLYKLQNEVLQVPSEELDIVRQYNLLVETNFKKWHQVQDYANEMHKSPKTLSNLFSTISTKSPLKIIHDRLVLEAKRLLIYTDLTIKEIAYELGFQEVPPFNRLFKKIATDTPSNFRKEMKS